MNRLVQNKSIFQKIILTCIVVVLVSFMCPIYSHADEWTLMGSLMKELASLVRGLGDVVVGLLNHFMLGTSELWKSSTLEPGDPNLSNDKSAVYVDINNVDLDADNVIPIKSGELKDTIWGTPDWKIPNVLYSPENIFANKIAALDVNFINPHTYTPAELVGSSSQRMATSSAAMLRDTISSWYKSLRNLAVVCLLSVLVYMGIRIILSSTAQDKAKYKKALVDWLVALCLVFMIHFIMSATMVAVEKLTDLFSKEVENGVIINIDDGATVFKTNFMGYMRFMAQKDVTGDAVAYTIIYIVLVIQTVMFTVQYLKRLLYMAFFTMIAPLVALTYPIDKMGDGQAQAFNLWFKEYTLNAVIQPVHLLLYTILITSAMSLAVNNPIYAIVAIGFLVPAEKFIKKMFKLDRAESAGGLGGFAGGALAMSGWQQITKALGNGKKKREKGDSEDSGKIRTQDNKESLPGTDNKDLAAWKNGDSDSGSNGNNSSENEGGENPRIREASQNGASEGGMTQENTGEDALSWDGWEPGDPSSPYDEREQRSGT